MPQIDLVAKLRYALRGFSYVVRHESSFRLELIAAALVQLAVLVFDLSIMAWAILTLATVVVLSAEVFNTALERLLDVVEPRLSDQVALLKNVLSAAVLLTVVGAALVILGLTLNSL